MTLTFGPANLLYSSNIELKHHLCNFLKQPMTVPVRCLPWLHITIAGYVCGLTSNCSADNTRSSVIGSQAPPPPMIVEEPDIAEAFVFDNDRLRFILVDEEDEVLPASLVLPFES